MYGSRRLHARRKLRELGRQLDAVELEHDAMRILERRRRDARRSPAPRGRRACTPAPATCARTRCAPTLRPRERRRRGAAPPARAASGTARRRSSEIAAIGGHGPASTDDHRGQASFTALRVRRRARVRVRRRRSAGYASVNATSGGGSRPATRSGHSTRHTASAPKQSASPAVSHSLDRRTDKNQSDKSISSKADNVQPAYSSGS